jgi:glycosyltransferase involved in cell wall biosynthesis
MAPDSVRRMHVGVSLLTLFPGRVGGSETYVRGLLGQFSRGHGPERLTVLANRHVMAAYGDEGVQLRKVAAYRSGDSNLTRFLAMNMGRVRPVLDGDQFDVLHYPVTVPIPRVRDTPTVVTLLDVQHHELPQMFSRAERWLRGWAYDDAARRADVVVTISEHAKAGIEHHLGIQAERIEVIPLGVDHDRFRPEGPRPLAGELPDRYIVYPANLWPHKNHTRLLDAFDRVDDDSLHLVMTGQAYGRESLVAGRERVHLLGHVPLERLPTIYRGAIAMVFPSLFEGFGLPVLEAMACGTPVACSNRGAVAEVTGDATLGFDPTDEEQIADAILSVSSDEELRRRLRAAGLAHARRFTWARSAEAHVDAYERALGA